jgi:predicted naringenin-chalcone synthase
VTRALARAWLGDFRVQQPAHRAEQGRALEWLAQAHAQAELALRSPAGEAEREALAGRVGRAVLRLASANDRIRWRSSVLADYTHTDWDSMELYTLREQPAGAPSSARTALYARVVAEVFERFYAPGELAPPVLMHVTCTGYDAPSGAQRLVSRRGWGAHTEVIHVYHMGCYAALPGIRLAAGLLAAGKPRVDLVHTELCTLHLDPTRHSAEQLMVQSLFADGLVRYSVWPAERAGGTGLELLASREEIVPASEADMSWSAGDRGMSMGISREVPERLRGALGPCLERLAAEADTALGALCERALFAVHPGGPRIVDEVRAALGLSEAQVAHSEAVLAAHGNMSSATLPHIWKALAEDAAVPADTPVVALAFGPGLTLSAALLRKRAAP